MKYEKWLEYAILVLLFSLLVTPLVVSKSLFFPFITGKNFFFRIVIEAAMVLWAILIVLAPSFRPRRLPIAIVLGSLSIILLIASLLGPDFSRSFWSNFERMEGVVTYFHLFLYFILLSSLLKDYNRWLKFFLFSVGVSVIVGLYGLSQLKGSIPINQGGVRLDATFGNATYLAVYMLFHVFLTIFLWLSSRASRRFWYLWTIVLGLQLFTLYHTATRGAVLGLIAGIAATAVILIFSRQTARDWRRRAAVFLLIISLGGLLFWSLRGHPVIQNSPVLSRFASISFSERTVESRFIVWRIGWQGFLERPILGWGPESFPIVFNKHYNPKLWNQEPWFDRAHNVFLDWLIAGGIIAATLYLALFFLAFFLLWRRLPEPLVNYKQNGGNSFLPIERAVFTGLLVAYLVNNLFVFDNLTSHLLFLAVLAYINYRSGSVIEATGTVEIPSAGSYLPKNKNTLAASFGLSSLILFSVIFYFVNWQPLRAGAEIIQALKSETADKGLEHLNQSLNPRTFGAGEAAEQATRFAEFTVQNRFPPAVTSKALGLANEALAREMIYHPLDARKLIFLGSLALSENRFADAIKWLERARELSPQKQTILFNLATAYINFGNTDRGLALLREAFLLDTSYEEARRAYALGALFVGRVAEAREVLEPVYGGPAVPDYRFIQFYLNRGSLTLARDSLAALVKENQTDWPGTILLAKVEARLGNRSRAIALLKEVSSRNQSLNDEVTAIIDDINAGRDLPINL